jgi:hypothetical protein
MTETSKKNWSKLIIPPALSQLLFLIAQKHGIPREDIHLFIYRMLKELYPEDVERLSEYLGAEWLDETPPSAE